VDRHLAVLEPVDQDLDLGAVAGRRADAVGPLGDVAVGGDEAD
jgi:hypothetical protein